MLRPLVIIFIIIILVVNHLTSDTDTDIYHTM